MSFRDLRKFTETMKALGYHRLISMENFKAPNFPLVAEILMWLVKSFEPLVEIPSAVDTESDRVFFIKAVAQFMMTKAQIKLNTKRLYQADGYAVKEMLKITSVLYGAMATKPVSVGDASGEVNRSRIDADVNVARQLASEITSKGASLLDLLGKEVVLREKRTAAIARPVQIDVAEKAVRATVNGMLQSAEKLDQMLKKCVSDKNILDAKIERKEQEVKRIEKRLQMLRTARPVFMDEYEQIEEELRACYEVYTQRMRNICFLENQLDEYNRMEMERSEEAEKSLRTMRRSLRKKEWNLWWSSYDKRDLGSEEDDGSDSDPDRNLSGSDAVKGGAARFTADSKTHVDEDEEDDEDEEEEEEEEENCMSDF